jgi:GcrA cell cycle regulator
MTNKSIWTPELFDDLRRLITTEGRSASYTAKRLGVSKNAVIGKCFRERIALSPDPRTLSPLLVRDIRVSTETAVALSRRLGVSPDCVSRVRNWHTHKTTPNLFPDGCLWGHGDPAKPGFHFCGGERLPGKPYCSTHSAVAYERRPVAAVEVV